jgi:lycopene beta-cyclase
MLTLGADRSDVVIAGSGPAALLAARSLARRGVGVQVVSPKPWAPWSNQYGVWLDEWTESGEHLSHVWPVTCARLKAGADVVLPRAYGRVDGPRWQASLLSQLKALKVTLTEDAVADVGFEAAGAEATLASGRSVGARLFVDAAGASSRWVAREAPPPASAPSFQSAYGVWVRVTGGRLTTPDAFLMMDYASSDPDDAGPPSFLYAMPLSPDGLYFVEETVMVGPQVPFEQLSARLWRRLDRLGLRVEQMGDSSERCLIPLSTPLPLAEQRALGFGASASMIHPATGYQLGYALSRVEPWADALTHALRATASLPSARPIWDALWPTDARRAHALYSLGGQTIAEMQLKTLRAFFRAFFHLPPERWSAYLSRRLPAEGVAASMLAVWRRSAPPLAWQLLRGALASPRQLLRGLIS